MAKKSDERILRETETTIQRLDKEGLPDAEIAQIMSAQGLPPEQTQAMLTRQRNARRQSVFWDGVKLLVLGALFTGGAMMAWTGMLDVRLSRQIFIALIGGGLGVLMLLGGIVAIVASITSRR